MKIRTPSSSGKLARKALSMPLAAVLAVGCAPLPAFAVDSAPDSIAGLLAASISERAANVKAQIAPESYLGSRYFSLLVSAANGLNEFKDDSLEVDGSTWAPSYTVFDIGYDGTPELLIHTDSDSGAKRVRVYTVESGVVTYLGMFLEPSGGKEAGSAEGGLYVANWGQGSSYVNEVTIEDGAVKSRRVTSGKATSDDPDGDIRTVTDYLSARGASWLTSADASDGSLLDEKAKFALPKGTFTVASAGAYTGAEKKPAVAVSYAGEALSAEADYRVTYKNNVNAGTATATVTGQGDYAGSKVVTFAIAKADISPAAVSVASGGSYTGSAKTPPVSVKLGTTALAQGSAYSVTYKNNKNAGKATATVTGKGNYTGSKSATFTIAKAANPMTLKSTAKTIKASTVAKAAQTFKAVSFSKKAHGKVTYKNVSSSAAAKKIAVNSSTGALTVKKGTAKGTYSVKVQATAAGDGNYNALSKTTTVKVAVK